MKRAQIFSLDIILAVIIFISIIIIVINAWDSTLEKTILNEQRNNLELLARNAFSLLIQTEDSGGLTVSLGSDNSTYNSRPMGLNKNGAWNLDTTKITDLQAMDYLASKNLLGLLRNDEQYYLTISEWDSTQYVQTYTLGLSPYANTTTIINLERFALLNNNWAKLNLKVWESG